MKQLVVLSGKGGTGKTTLTSSFAALSGACVLVDADVDAADLHLVVAHERQESGAFVSGQEAFINRERCLSCGQCRMACRFEAITEDFHVDPLSCEGCGVCVRFCPAAAITMHERDCGQWFRSVSPHGPFLHAQLHIAADNSGKLVSLLREKAREAALASGIGLILIDGSPGVGCPVIASVTGADAALLVTEPSPSGMHDLKRAAELTRHFGVPTYAVVNKADLCEEKADEIEAWCNAHEIKILGRIPFDPAVLVAMTGKTSLVECSAGPAAQAVKELWTRLSGEMNPNNTSSKG